MSRLYLAKFALALSGAMSCVAAAGPCPRQPMPSPINSLSPLPPHLSSISFAAVPSRGGQAWAIRLHRAESSLKGVVEILHLRRQGNCNRYDVDTKWQTPLSDHDYRSLVDKSMPFGSGSPKDDIVLDGTQIVLSVRSSGGNVTESFNHYGRGGGQLSAIFHGIVSKHVPGWQVPFADWQSRSE